MSHDAIVSRQHAVLVLSFLESSQSLVSRCVACGVTSRKRLVPNTECHQRRFWNWGRHWRTMFTNRNPLSHGQTGRVDDLHDFQSHRHRWVCFGHQWDCQRRIGKWQRAVVQHAMGRNHHRFNSWSCESRCCRTLRIHVVQKSESGDYIRLKKMDVLYLEVKFVRGISLLVKDNLKKARLWRCWSRGQVLETGLLKGTRLSAWKNTPKWFVFKEGECEKGNMCDHGIHQSVLLIKKKVEHLTLGVCSSILNRANRRSQIIQWWF